MSYQERLDEQENVILDLEEQLKLEKNIKTLIVNDALKEEELVLDKNGKFVKDEIIAVHLYYSQYYNTYVSERGAMYDVTVEVNNISLDLYNDYHNFIKEKNDQMIERYLLDEFGCMINTFHTDVQIGENGIKFKYVGNENDTNTITSGGFALILMKESKANEIKNAKKHWDFVEDVDFEYSKLWLSSQKMFKSFNIK